MGKTKKRAPGALPARPKRSRKGLGKTPAVINQSDIDPNKLKKEELKTIPLYGVECELKNNVHSMACLDRVIKNYFHGSIDHLGDFDQSMIHLYSMTETARMRMRSRIDVEESLRNKVAGCTYLDFGDGALSDETLKELHESGKQRAAEAAAAAGTEEGNDPTE